MTHRNGNTRRIARLGLSLPLAFALLLPRPGSARAEDVRRSVNYYVNISVEGKPSLDDMWERMRVAQEVGIDQMTRYPSTRESLSIAGMMDPELWDYQENDLRNTLRAEIKRVYAELSSVRKQADAVRQTRDVLKEIVDISGKRYAVGKGSQPELLRAQVLFHKMREELLLIENREKLLQIRLNVLSGQPPTASIPPIEELTEFSFPYAREDLFKMYQEERPLLLAIRRTVERGRSMSSATDIRELRYLDAEAMALLSSALASIQARASVLAIYRTSIIPQAEQALQATMEAYRVGKVEFPLLLDSALGVLSYRREYQALLGDTYVLKAKVESVVGKELR